jgi:hypothetical protein
LPKIDHTKAGLPGLLQKITQKYDPDIGGIAHFWYTKLSTMKKTIITFGGIAGLIFSVFIIFLGWINSKTPGHVGSLIFGYAVQVIAFSFIFVAIKNFRDKLNGGMISFGKALRIGLGITLIGGTLYVLLWLVDFYAFNPDFMVKYAAQMVKEVKDSGVSQAIADKKISDINSMMEMYKSPVFVVIFTYVEVLPTGIILSLLAALILKRKRPAAEVRAVA